MFLHEDMKLRREILHLLLNAMDLGLFLFPRGKISSIVEKYCLGKAKFSVWSYPFTFGCRVPLEAGCGRLRKALNVRKPKF